MCVQKTPHNSRSTSSCLYVHANSIQLVHRYVLASKVVIIAVLVAADSPATPLLRAATNKEYVVPD